MSRGLVIGKVIHYPYVHFSHSNYLSDKDSGLGVKMYQDALSRAKQHNSILEYVSKHYPSDLLQYLEDLYGELDEKTIAQWENQLVDGINSQITRQLQDKVNNLINTPESVKTQLSSASIKKDYLQNFLLDVRALIIELGADPQLINTLIGNIYSVSGNKTTVSLIKLKQALAPIIQQMQGCLVSQNDTVVMTFLNKLNKLLSQKTKNGNDLKSLGKRRVQSFIRDAISTDLLEMVAPTALQQGLNQIFDQTTQVIVESSQTGKLRRPVTQFDSQGNMVFGNSGRNVPIKPDSVTNFKVTTQGASGQYVFDIGISTKMYKDSTVQKYGVNIQSTSFYKFALATLQTTDSIMTQHILSNTIVHQKHSGTGYETLRMAILKRYLVSFLSGTSEYAINSNVRDSAQILFFNNKAYSIMQIIQRTLAIDDAKIFNDMFSLAYPQSNEWEGPARIPDPTEALKRSRKFINSLHKIQMQVKFHPEEYFKILGL